MKQIINDLIAQSLRELQQDAQLSSDLNINIQVTPAKDPSQGDFASNVALTLAKQAGMAPRVLAEVIIDRLPAQNNIDRVEVAGPGFINFFVSSATSHAVVQRILEQGDFGLARLRDDDRDHVETVALALLTVAGNAPLGRGAAHGATGFRGR